MKQTLNLEQKTLKFSDFEALNEQELREIEGGKRIPWRKIFDYADDLLTAIGVMDAIDQFVEGWNSVDCKCE